MKETSTQAITVGSEIGTLRRLLVHSPDSGLGKVVPSKAQDWLFEDIVHLETIRRKEYDYYTKILLYFLDPEKIKGRLREVDDPVKHRDFYKPSHAAFFASENVIELQWLLAEILEDPQIKLKLVASVCAIEGCSYHVQSQLMTMVPYQLANTFISGSLDNDTLLFAPIPNFIFTRDIGIVINDHILLNKPAKHARSREALLAKYIFYNHRLFKEYRSKVIELPESHHHFLMPKDSDDRRVTLEGGDVMVVSPSHVLIGVSERTSWEAAHQAINLLFEKNIVEKVTVIKIPKKRDYMHIDTIFTQIKRDTWVMLGHFSQAAMKKVNADPVQRELEQGVRRDEQLKITQFHKQTIDKPTYFDSLEELLIDVSKNDLGCASTPRVIFSGNNEFPFDAREQWTDSCNLLAIKEGVVLGYDRNDKTVEAFRYHGFCVISAEQLIDQLEADQLNITTIKDTLILMPSAELSRARGGFHCMSMPLLRDAI